MFLQLLLKNTSADYQRYAKDTVSETSSMLMRAASSTNRFSASSLYRHDKFVHVRWGKTNKNHSVNGILSTVAWVSV